MEIKQIPRRLWIPHPANSRNQFREFWITCFQCVSLCVWDWCSSAYIHTPGRTGLEGINRTYVWFVRHHFYCGSSSGLFLICWNWFFLTWKQKDIGVNVIGKVRLSVEIHSVCKVIIEGRVKGFGWCSQWRSVCEGYSPPGMLRRLCIVKWKHVLGVGQRWISGRVLAKNVLTWPLSVTLHMNLVYHEPTS